MVSDRLQPLLGLKTQARGLGQTEICGGQQEGWGHHGRKAGSNRKTVMMDSETCTLKTQLEPETDPDKAAQRLPSSRIPQLSVSHPDSGSAQGMSPQGKPSLEHPADMLLVTPHYLSYIPQVTGPTLEW